MKISRLIVWAMAALCSLSCMAQKQEWTPLINGKNLKDWKKLNGTADYTLEAGTITGISKTGSPNTFLATAKEYTNFILEYDVKMDEGLNSGVQLRSHSLPAYHEGRVHGLQVECEDSQRAWAGGLYDEDRRGWRYPLEYNPAAKTAFKKGEWNTYRVLAFNNHILTWVNGTACAHLIEESSETGFIALQVHAIGDNQALAGKKIQWRNIRIKEATEGDFQQLADTGAPEVSYLRNQLTDRETRDGWQLLWDGVSNQGWRGARADGFPDKGWTIADGELKVMKSGGAESAHGGDIVTMRKFKNFILEVDFKITRGANSGIKYFVGDYGGGDALGLEYQLLDDERHADAKQGKDGNRTIASLYDIQPRGRLMTNVGIAPKVGEWQHARIVARADGNIEHWLNGVNVLTFKRGSEDFKRRVAASKFKDIAGFGQLEQGRIRLQDHGDEVSFRSIKIRAL